MAAPSKGRFITLEGGEGVGKSTQARLLAERLEPMGIAVVVTREPGGSPGAEALREVILSGKAAPFGPAGEAILFSAARIDHIDNTIAPALKRGASQVLDVPLKTGGTVAPGTLSQRALDASLELAGGFLRKTFAKN